MQQTQQQDDNNNDGDDWQFNDAGSCVDVGVGGGGSGGNHSRHGLGENGKCRSGLVRGFEFLVAWHD